VKRNNYFERVERKTDLSWRPGRKEGREVDDKTHIRPPDLGLF